ncbi:aldehyde dehydrogenase family protein, partial [Salmonella enterica]|uniref:aldehyde dehydrogenase family protein n=1 Tax=Salmonella enterica TaxID=28901 RepID=UPI000A47CA9E
EEGDTIVYGGENFPGEGDFFQPTAGKKRRKKSTLMHEETFGPVCSFIGFQNEKKALLPIKDSPFGLAASVWAGKISKALRYAEDIDGFS